MLKRNPTSSAVVERPGEVEVTRLSQTYRLSNEALSRVTGASPRTVSYWSAGTIAPQRSSAHKLKEVTRLFDALSDVIKANAVGPWLQKPNHRFDGSTPLQVIERGESDRIWRMIWELREARPVRSIRGSGTLRHHTRGERPTSWRSD